MKKLLLILLCLPFIGFGQNVNIPDANFKAYLVGNTLINTNGDTEIQVSEANSYNQLMTCGYLNIVDLTGIEEFTSLTFLSCQGNQITNLNLNNNTSLDTLDCMGNMLTSLSINNSALKVLWCGDNPLTSLDVSGAISLTDLRCNNGQLTSLDVSNNYNLTTLICKYNQLTSLDLGINTMLNFLECFDNQLSNLDLSNTNLIDVYCSNNELINLNLNGANSLETLVCSNNKLTNLDATNNINLFALACDTNQLISIDLRNGNNISLEFLWCNSNTNLSCINVDDAAWSTTNWTDTNYYDIDPQHYFSNNCSGATSLQEHTKNKELLKVTDLLGRETKQTNQPLFYIYDDGTVEKRIVIE